MREVQQRFAALRHQMLRRELAKIPVARLKDTTDGRLRLGPLEASGYGTVLDVLEASPTRLQQVPNVGPQTAMQAHAAARQIAAAVEEGLKVRIDLDPADPVSGGLVSAVHHHDRVDRALAPLRESASRLDVELSSLIAAAAPARGRVRHFFTGSRRKAEAADALSRLQHWISWADQNRTWESLDQAARVIKLPPPSQDAVWQDFQKRSPEYYGVLGQLVDLKLDVAASEGFLPAEIVARVHEQALDDTFRRVSLRGYQSFGARFALVQRRVIIGDEMGLGKTIEAIAAMAHLKATGATHFLVVCPASVLINWTREVALRSTLRVLPLYGPERGRNLKTWISRGDVAVTTYESLRGLETPVETAIGMLVVDEAHYAKNPSAQRSRSVATWVDRAQRVLFLTGTPMENRVEEFRNLVAYRKMSSRLRQDRASCSG